MLLLSAVFQLLPFKYDSAAYSAQNGQWKDVHEKLNSLLVDSPESADLLYDAGVASHNLENFPQAQAYFMRAAEHAHENDLKCRAYYNAGNAYVPDKKLKEALECYDQALVLDQDNEYIKHNRDVVARMLEEQQKQEQEQEQKDEENKEDKENKKDEQNKEDKKDQKSDSGDSQNQDKKDKGQKDQNSDRNDNSDQQDKGQQDQDSDSDGDQDQKDQGQQKQDKKSSKDNKSGSEQNNNKKDQLSDSDKNKRDQNSDFEDSQNQLGQDKEAQAAEALEQKLDNPWLMSVLDKQEERDKAMNKQLMGKKIGQHGGKNGQNCW